MKKLFLLSVSMLCLSLMANAQIKETFDSNYLEWTECAYKNALGTAMITEGKMILKSKGEMKGLGIALTLASGQDTKVREATFFETHCYAPIDIMKPFMVKSKVNVQKLGEDRNVGLVFNYKDGGTFYCFSFNDDCVQFIRYVDGRVAGSIMQGVKWTKKRGTDMEWILESDGSTLDFKVDGMSILKIRHMPLEYTGFGYYAYGAQELEVDEVEFIQ